jgi:hypothetical protein
MKSVLSVLVLAGAMGSSIASAAGADGVILKDASTEGSYCHMKFPAIDERTLGSKRPVLKDPSLGDIIDFYGSCNHDPLGKDEIHAQHYRMALKIDANHRSAHEYLGELYLDMNQPANAEKQLQVLRRTCPLIGKCAEYDDLKAAIEKYKTQ